MKLMVMPYHLWHPCIDNEGQISWEPEYIVDIDLENWLAKFKEKYCWKEIQKLLFKPTIYSIVLLQNIPNILW